MSFEKIEKICGKKDADELRDLQAKVDLLLNGPFAQQPSQKSAEKKPESKSSK